MVSRWIYWVCLVAMILSLGYFGFWMAIIGSWLPGFPWIYHLTDAVILCAAISIVTYRKRPRWTLLCAWAFFSVCLWVYQIFRGSHELLVDHGSVTGFLAGVTYRAFVSTARSAA